MTVDFVRVRYDQLNSRQQEAYNFQKVSALLADFGFVTIRLTNDWRGVDFIAQHFDGTTFLKVQLKGRLCFYKKYQDSDLFICFRDAERWYLYPHNELLAEVLGMGLLTGTKSWDVDGGYHFPVIPKQLEILLEPYRVEVK